MNKNAIRLHVEPVQSRGQPDHVIASLMSLIKRGVLKEGDLLPPERNLAKQFNVGRNALREAIKSLKFMDLSSARPRSARSSKKPTSITLFHSHLQAFHQAVASLTTFKRSAWSSK